MSFPSEGRTAMFRNPMTEVSKFMKTKDRIYPFDRIDPIYRNGPFDIDPYDIPKKHPEHFHVWNLCAERGYEAHWFENRCGRLLVDDHNVPKLKELVS